MLGCLGHPPALGSHPEMELSPQVGFSRLHSVVCPACPNTVLARLPPGNSLLSAAGAGSSERFFQDIPDIVADSHLSASPRALRKVRTAAPIAVRAFPTQLRPFCFQDSPCLSEQLFWALPEPPNLLWRGLDRLSQAQVPNRISLHQCWVALETGERSLSVQRSTVWQGIS